MICFLLLQYFISCRPKKKAKKQNYSIAAGVIVDDDAGEAIYSCLFESQTFLYFCFLLLIVEMFVLESQACVWCGSCADVVDDDGHLHAQKLSRELY